MARRPEGLFLVGAVSQYLGAAIAVSLFDQLAPRGVAWLRIIGAAVIVLAVRRSWRRSFTRRQLITAGAFGSSLAAMNLSFYMALDELPLGNAVAIEFAGPIAVAAVGIRSGRNLAALALTVAGIVLLAEVSPDVGPRGVGFALLAAFFWAGYIVLGQRVAVGGADIDGLGVGMAIGAVVIAPFGAGPVGPVLDEPWILLVALSTGLFSNAIPYSIDQVVLRLVTRVRFALLQALLPATATIIGVVALRQVPSGLELVGIGAVIAALVLSSQDEPVAIA